MPFLLVEILNFQGSAHLRGVGSLSILVTVVSIIVAYGSNRIVARLVHV